MLGQRLLEDIEVEKIAEKMKWRLRRGCLCPDGAAGQSYLSFHQRDSNRCSVTAAGSWSAGCPVHERSRAFAFPTLDPSVARMVLALRV